MFQYVHIISDDKVCPSSIQNYFQTQGLQCHRLRISKTLHKFQDLRVPVIDPEIFSPDSNQNSCSYEEMFEWLGACAVGIDL